VIEGLCDSKRPRPAFCAGFRSGRQHPGLINVVNCELLNYKHVLSYKIPIFYLLMGQ